ncbi:MAG TPA: hypothetical protein VFA63_11520 [Pseudonocardiaceae bacterium]|nr:hypothetical protein [Pseudonocardiaceae bacterium]
MDAYLRQQFDVLLLTAADRFTERIIQRCGGYHNAQQQLQSDPDGPGSWLSEFVDAVFTDFCLDDAAGACFVLQAAPKHSVSIHCEATVTDILQSLAKDVFAALLLTKVVEALARGERYG